MYLTGLGMVVLSLSLLIFVGIILFILLSKKKSSKNVGTDVENDSVDTIVEEENSIEQDKV